MIELLSNLARALSTPSVKGRGRQAVRSKIFGDWSRTANRGWCHPPVHIYVWDSSPETGCPENGLAEAREWGTIGVIRGTPRNAAETSNGQRRARCHSSDHDAEHASVRNALPTLRSASGQACLACAVCDAETFEGSRGRHSAVGFWMGEL